MSLDTALSVAAGGLRAAERGLRAVAANVAGAGTDGYTRKTLVRESIVAGGEFSGVRARDVARSVDEALQQRMYSSASEAEALAVRERFLAPVEAMHGRPEDGDSLGGLVGSLRDSFTALLADPASAVQQATVVDAADGVARRLAALSGTITTQRQGVQDALVGALEEVNQGLARVGELTRAIRSEVSAGRRAADLEDRRDAELARLSEDLDLTFLKKEDGGLTILGRGGLSLPLAGIERLETESVDLGPAAYYAPEGGPVPAIRLASSDPDVPDMDVTRRLVGGRIGELIRLRDEILPRQQAELDALAHGLATRFDQQGLRLFTDGAGAFPKTGPAPDPRRFVGFASDIRVNAAVLAEPHLVRDGTHDVLASDSQPRGSAFVVNDPAAGGTAGFAALAERVVDFTFGAQRAAGVPHVPTPNRSLGPRGDLTSSLAAASTIQDQASSLVSVQTGDYARTAATLEDAVAFRGTMEARFEDGSGVDVDAEMALMIQLQNAYQANSRVVAASEAMWQSLVAAVR